MMLEYRRATVIGNRPGAAEAFAGAVRGIALDGDRRLYVVGDEGLWVFEPDGVLHRRQDTERVGHCVATDRAGVIHVGESGQVEVFRNSGERVGVWRDAERLGRVTALGFHESYILAADAEARCIRRFDLQGRWINDIGDPGGARGFLIPNGCLDFAVDERGVVYAPNPAKHRVERYSLEGRLLGHFGRWGQADEDFAGCCNPTNLTLQLDGRVVVSEKADPRVKVYTSDGRLVAIIPSAEFDSLSKNMDLAVDSRGTLYVLDTARRCVVVFEPFSEAPREPSSP